MRRSARIALSFVCSCLAFAALGCAEMDFDPAPPPQPFVASEHLCARLTQGDANIAAIKQDLAVLLRQVPSGITVKFHKRVATSDMHAMLDGAQDLQSYSHKDNRLYHFTLGTIVVTDSRVTISNAMSFGFDELANSRISFVEAGEFISHPYAVHLNGLATLNFADKDLARCVVDEFSFIKNQGQKSLGDKQLEDFLPLAEQYRAMSPKPAVSEEQRRYIVQANALAQQKEFSRAIALYAKALELNPFSYPAAYYNMALIAAQEHQYGNAIIHMKKYLLLVPQAEDARSAQDKIYEWEALSGVH